MVLSDTPKLIRFWGHGFRMFIAAAAAAVVLFCFVLLLFNPFVDSDITCCTAHVIRSSITFSEWAR